MPRKTKKPVTARPPFHAGAAHDTVTLPLPATTFTSRGAPGVVAGASGRVDASFDATLVPTELIAFTVKKAGAPLANPVTV